ncbi:ArgE/DapE family deacylase [Roseomonas sp. 18066]|uniref:ArgE/DapE family deacylase n=1 Tax=Roseomonas sp. 18066 TaxID=2681412 RepID=UPI001359A757|nr:ArgE/DapE family deacylase [Roseomonas sp. 18066]
MPDQALLKRLEAAVDAAFNKQVAFLSELTRFPSLRGQEAPLQDWLSRQLADRGYAVDRYTLADIGFDGARGAAPVMDTDYSRAVQLVAARRAKNPGGRSLIIQGHVDVVPAGPAAMWTTPPFEPVVRDGWLYGRGANDMKAGVSAMIFAADALAACGLEPDGDLYLQSVTEEECTGNGALSTLLRGYRAEACLIPEPTGNALTRAHVGVIWFRLKVMGIPVHVARSETGTNAIVAAYKLIEALQAHTREENLRAKSHPRFGALKDPIKFNPGVIRGGDWGSSTPAWCEVDCRIGLLPGDDLAGRRAAIEQVVRQAAAGDEFLANNPPAVEWNGFMADGFVQEEGSAAEAVLAAAHAQVFGEKMAERCSTGVNDTRFYGLYYDMPALCYGPKGEGSHAFDERSDLANVKQTTLAMAAFIADWCGVREVSR